MEIKAVKGWMFQLHLSFKSGLKMKPIPRGQHGENAPFEPDILNCSVMNINLYSVLIFSNELGSCIAKRGISKLILLGISCRNALSEIQLLLSVFCNFSLSLSLPDEDVQQQKSPSKWNETDLDVSYKRKPHHTYDSWLISASLLFCTFNI